TVYSRRSTGHLIFAAIVLVGCGKGSASSGADSTEAGADTVAAPSSLSLPVVGEEVRKGDLILTVSTTGQIRSEAVVPLKVEAAGEVTEVLARAGDRVKKGQAIVRLDPRPFDIAVAEAEAALRQAQLQLLDNTLPDSLVSGKAVTGERLRNAEVRSGVETARVRLEKAKYERERSAVTAPFDGTLDDLRISPGERVTAGQELGKLVDLENLRIDAAVLEHDLPLIRPGGEALVTTAAAPDRPVRGRIATVLPLVDSATRAGRALIRVQGNGVLRPGMYADVRLEATRLSDRIVVPARAVIERDNRPLVFVVRDGRAQWTYIQPGRTNGIETEVLPDSTTGQIPLNPGDIVLVEGHLTLTHDAPVRVVPKAEAGRRDGGKPDKN
ncbi:MAG TPA: efflux RND transporter periplasmic adaptor subunit, partial [Gemmatimonadales bacterium]|nr:efflux RND transporter periplasmic adaptor subunit [Gemmatimonadales bacterium]